MVKTFIKKNTSEKVKVGPSESMSKSKKNTIDPEKMIEEYGADAVRLFILSDSPPEKDIQWSESGMSAAYKFIQKFWLMTENILNLIEKDVSDTSDKNIDVFTNQSINKINIALEKFRYNVIVAVFHDIYNFYIKVSKNKKNLKENFEKILIVMMPVIPHLASECLDKIKKEGKLTWPNVNKNFLELKEKEIVIQVNGKKRGNILIDKNISEAEIIEKINKIGLIDKYIENKKINKTIYVKERLINIIVK